MKKRLRLPMIVLSMALINISLISTSTASSENQIQKVNISIDKSKYSSLEQFIEKVLLENNSSINKNIINNRILVTEPFSLLKTESILKEDEYIHPNATKNEKRKKIKEMQRLANYISITYNIPLEKAEKIVYYTFIESYKKELDPNMVLSIISVESMFQQYSKSHAGAVGLTQVMARVHRARISENKVDIWSIDGNIQIGTDILKDYVGLANGNVKKALQMYNGSSKDTKYRYSNKVMKTMQGFIVAAK